MLRKHGFTLKKWCSTNPRLLQNIHHEDPEVNLDFNSDSTNTVKRKEKLNCRTYQCFCVLLPKQSSAYMTSIQSLTVAQQWRLVKSKDNHADLQPPTFSSRIQIPNDSEKKSIVPISAVAAQADKEFVYRINHRGSFRKTMTLRNPGIISKCHHPQQMALTPDEMENSLHIILWTVQTSDFNSSSISSLTPVLSVVLLHSSMIKGLCELEVGWNIQFFKQTQSIQ